MNKLKLIFSFDDCNIGDLRAAQLLSKYGFTGTFYMSSVQVKGTQQLTLKEIYEGLVLKGMEIGGHTVSHPQDMKALSNEQMKFEIENNKFLCEMMMKKKVTTFAYPRGRHDERVRAAVKAAGYLEARTTVVKKLQNDTLDPLQTPTTIHMFAREEYEGEDWLELAKSYLKSAVEMVQRGEKDVFFSCWGHTTELTRNSEWGKFEELLKEISLAKQEHFTAK